jgi:hypothetical protein
VTAAGLERQSELLYKIVNTFGIFKRGSINGFNVFSVCLVFLTKFNNRQAITNIENIKNLIYKMLAHTQRYIGRVTTS